MMGRILVFAFAAAVYPQLLAVVVVILTRTNPLPLLWVCYIACLLVSLGTSAAFLIIFHDHGSIAGTSSTRFGPAAYLVLGCIALMLAVLLATSRTRMLLTRRVTRLPDGNQPAAAHASSDGSTRAGQLPPPGSAACRRGCTAITKPRWRRSWVWSGCCCWHAGSPRCPDRPAHRHTAALAARDRGEPGWAGASVAGRSWMSES
jgi:Sap, sulfolipid-1-addressing protein